MRVRTPTLVLLAALLLAGCLEEPPAAPATGPGAGLGRTPSLPVPSLLPSPPAPTPEVTPAVTITSPTPLHPPREPAPEGLGEVLHRSKRDAVGPEGRVVLDVPEGVRTLRVEVEANGTYEGEVTLTSSQGVVVARFVVRSGAVNLHDPPAGRWLLRHSPEVGGEVVVTVTLYRETPPQPSGPVPPGVAYTVRWPYEGRVNRTDRFTVLPGHERLVGTLAWFDRQAPGSASWAENASVYLQGPRATFSLTCRPPDPCRVDVPTPEAGAWMVYYGGHGTGGLAYVNLTLQGEGERPTTSVELYDSGHAYWSWGDRRGDFGEGFTVPIPLERLSMFVQWTRPFEEGTLAAVDLVSPSGAALGTCALSSSRVCEVDLQRPIEPGLYETRYRGTDRTGAVSVYVKGI